MVDRRLPVAVALAALVLTLPSLGVGWVMDDLWHRAMLLRTPLLFEFLRSPLDLFRFFDGDADRTRRLMDLGVVPWWVSPEAKGAFWRPVTAATHWLDYALWPNRAPLMHLHSVLWYAGLVFAVAVLYRRMMGPTVAAALAALLYAVDDARGMAAGFLANRNVLPAALFGVCALVAHDAWRRERKRWSAAAAPALLTISLLSKESGIATVAYLAAYAVFLDGGSRASRVGSILPYVLLVAAWRIVWSALGYGVAGIGVYVDPLTDLSDFVVAMLVRAPMLLLGQWSGPPSEIALLMGRWIQLVLWVAGIVVVGVLGMAMWPLLRRDRMARFWGAGMILSVVPACTTFPADRLLFFVGIGSMGLLGRYLAAVFGDPVERGGEAVTGRWRRSVGMALLVIHLVVAPIGLVVRSAMPVGPKSMSAGLMVRTPMDDSVAEQDVVVVNPPSVMHAMYLPVLRALEGKAVPRHTRILAPGDSGMEVRRPDEQTLVLRPEHGYLHGTFDRLFRDEDEPLGVGSRVELTGVQIEVVEATAGGRPLAVRFRFDVPLEDASLRWLWWNGQEFAPYAPPAVREMARLGGSKNSTDQHRRD